MKQSRLDEILKKENVSNEELAEILGSMFVSVSKHMKEVKTKLEYLESKMNSIENIAEKTIQNVPVFGVITDFEDDEPDD